jgi:hypothetical protein
MGGLNSLRKTPRIPHHLAQPNVYTGPRRHPHHKAPFPSGHVATAPLSPLAMMRARHACSGAGFVLQPFIEAPW